MDQGDSMPSARTDRGAELNPWGATMSTAEQRQRWRSYHQEHERIAAEWRERGYTYPPPEFPSFPEDLRGLACGARTRKGTPCKRTDLYLSGRCKLHGGFSTGPTTPEGKARAALNGRRPKRRKRTP
jgi:hypothetical protein